MTGFLSGIAIATVASLLAFAVVALVAFFHKAINVYRGAGLLTVLMLMAAVATFSFQLIADPDLASPSYIGMFVGLGLAATVLLAKARSYTPSAMLPPPPPPRLGSVDPEGPVPDQDPFT